MLQIQIILIVRVYVRYSSYTVDLYFLSLVR